MDATRGNDIKPVSSRQMFVSILIHRLSILNYAHIYDMNVEEKLFRGTKRANGGKRSLGEICLVQNKYLRVDILTEHSPMSSEYAWWKFKQLIFRKGNETWNV